MKRLFYAIASIALLAGVPATAKPDHGRGQQHHNRGGGDHERDDDRGDHRVNHRGGGRHEMRERRTYSNYRNHRDNGLHRGWARDRGSSYRWQRGERMGYNDWYGAPRVDYRRYNLRRPPYGYQWRRYNDRYVLVAASTGLILSVILNSGR